MIRKYDMEIIVGLANMQARNYSVQEVDKLEAKFIAGHSVPATGTTTTKRHSQPMSPKTFTARFEMVDLRLMAYSWRFDQIVQMVQSRGLHSVQYFLWPVSVQQEYLS